MVETKSLFTSLLSVFDIALEKTSTSGLFQATELEVSQTQRTGTNK